MQNRRSKLRNLKKLAKPGAVVHRTLACLLLITALLVLPLQEAGAASTTLQVSARILPWLKVSTTPHTSSYQVDSVALERGYIDLPRSLSVHLTTNLQQDIELELNSFGPEGVQVASIGSLRIATPGRNIPVVRELDLRILLPEGIAQGTYPLQVNVSALGI